MSIRLLIACFAVVCLAGGLQAQQLTGAIEGTVTDPQGAVIPGVRVVATHVETNSVYEGETSAVGQFAFPSLRLGNYNIAAESDGFKRAVITGVQVTVGGTTSVNLAMEIGAVSEEVTVTADMAQVIVNTVDAEISTVVDDRRVLELPLNGRNAVELTLQQAGVYFERNADGQGDKLFVNGQRHNSLQITLDGVDTQDNFIKTSTIMVDQPLLAVTAENVQEFRVVTGNASAEYSQGGSHVSAVTRAGTNEFHGSLFWFNRNDAFSANDFFNNSSTPKVDTPPLNRNQFGGRIGGPIVKNKFFFYVGYQQTRESRGFSVNRTVYTSQALQGIYRYVEGIRTTPESVAQNPDKIRTINLFECGASIMGQFERECFDGRFSLANRPGVDPIMSTVFGAMPLPNNFDRGDGLNTGGLRFNSKSLTVEHLPSIRLDYRLNDANSLYATFNYTDRDIDGDFINDREPRFPGMDALGSRVTHARGISLSWTSTLRPTLVNEARVGFLGGENAFLIDQPFDTPFTLDLNTITDPYAPGNGSDVRDNRTVNVRNVMSWMKGNHQLKFGFEYRQRFADTYSEDRVGRIKRIEMDDNDAPPDFSSTDLRNFGGGRINSSDSENARDLMNNLVGAVENVIERFNVTSLNSGFVPFAVERRKYRNNAVDLFINDSWRIKPGLTLNLGLRWEWAGVPVETEGLALNPEGNLLAGYGVSGPGGFFNPGAFNGTPCATLGQLPMEVSSANARALIEDCATQHVPGTGANGRPLWDEDYNNFAPVISIAWDPFGDGKTSIRTGFRISYLKDNFNIVDGNLDDNEGLRVDQQCNPVEGPTCNSSATFLSQISSSGVPTPNTPAFALPSTRSILDSSVMDFRTFDKNLSTAYYSEWTFGISREVGHGWAVEARYLGNRGVGLRRVADFNEINVNAVDPVTGQSFLDAFVKAQHNLACNGGSRFDDATGNDCIIPNPLMKALIAGEASRLRRRNGLVTALERNQTGQFVHRLTQAETSRPKSGQSRIRGGSFWGQVLDGRFPVNFFQANPFVASSRVMVNDGFSTYHSLQLEVRRRFAQGLSVQTNYTYGKALADYDGDSSLLVNDVRPSSVINPRYSKQEFMPRHQLNANWVYELPIGVGKPFLNSGGMLNKFVGGWQLSGLLAFRSGRPLSISSNVGTFHRNAISDDNTVDVASGVTAVSLRDGSGVRDIGSGVFFVDPCLSGFNNVDCTGAGGVQSGLSLPQPGRLGALGQTVLFGSNRFLLDMSLMKRTRIRERYDIEFRWEVFNVLNRTNFGAPTLDITSASFGQIQNTITEPRLMQFALKLNF